MIWPICIDYQGNSIHINQMPSQSVPVIWLFIKNYVLQKDNKSLYDNDSHLDQRWLMLSLVTTPSNTPSAVSIDDKYQQWQYFNAAAYQAHKQKKYAQATKHFEKSLSLSQELKEHFFEINTKKSGIELYYFSTHNLAACLNTQQKGIAAKDTLLKLHNYLIELITNQFKPRMLRVEALSFLDKSLFSLSSQLAYLNKVENIHTLITHTETIATTAANVLFESEYA